jgi:hypothetical protein
MGLLLGMGSFLSPIGLNTKVSDYPGNASAKIKKVMTWFGFGRAL